MNRFEQDRVGPQWALFLCYFPLLLKYGSCVASKVRLGDAWWAPLQSLSCVLLRNSFRPLNTVSHQYEFDWFSCFPPVLLLLSLCIDPLGKDEWLWRRGCQECNEWGSVCRLAALLLNIASRFLVSYHRAHIRSTSIQGDKYGRGGDFCWNQANSSVIILASNTKLPLPHCGQQKLFHHQMGQPVISKTSHQDSEISVGKVVSTPYNRNQ